MSIQGQSDVNGANPMSIHCQYYTILVSIQCQSCVDPTPFQSYQSSSTIQLIPNPQPIRCQFSVHPMPIQRQSRTNPAPIQHQSSTNLVSIQSINMAPIWCQSNANRMSIKNQSATNPHHLVVNSSPIRQSFDNPRPIQNLTPIRCQSMTNLPIHDKSANPWAICQSMTNLPIKCQSNDL